MKKHDSVIGKQVQSETNQIEQPTGPLNQIQNSLSGIDVREYWHVFLRHKWRIIGLAIVITLISGLKVFSEVPIYRSTAKLLIEREGARYVDVQDVYSSNYDWEYYQTQYEILKSRPIAERVVNKLKLDKAPAKKESKPKSSLLDWKKWLPDDWFKKPKEVTQLQRHISTVGFVKGGIQVEPVRNSHLVKISFEGASPQQITSIVNAIAEAYIEETLEGRLAMTQKATSWLTERMSGLREKLDESERKLQAYKDREKVIDTQGDSQLASQEIQILTSQLGKARQDLVAKKELRSKLRQANGSTQKLIKMPALLAHPLVQSFHAKLISAQQKERELGKTYGPLHPKMISAKSEREQAENALSSQLSAAAKSIESEYRIAQEQVDQLRSRLNQAKTSAMTVDRKQFQLESLKRDVEANRQLYEQFQQRFKENNATGGVQSANARLLEPALVPNTPIRPNKRRTVMVSLILGLMAGFGLALLLEHLDNTIKGAEDIEKRLSIPMLGMLPLLDVTDKKDLSPMRHFSDNNRSSFSEAVRTIRTGVLLSALDDPHKVILVTSSVPGEGKTTLSMNLSYALGHMKKVLLIDADMRRPMVGKASKTEKTALGLSQFISGSAKFSECVRKMEGSDLWVMSAGVIPPNPLELLSSQKFKDAISTMQEKFDHVVIDCAPTLAVSDALVLSKLASAVIYVVKADSTPHQAAQTGVGRLQRVNAHLIGAVLNRVESRSKSYYGKYSYYYGNNHYYEDYGYHSK